MVARDARFRRSSEEVVFVDGIKEICLVLSMRDGAGG